jgi:hypothetical protein
VLIHQSDSMQTKRLARLDQAGSLHAESRRDPMISKPVRGLLCETESRWS